ncbi:hypothetical protein SAY86_018019 [Trapa natans]|uniref:Protein kinase domain-containing protein n=1 Tax=Trapa natans TaxID=22666 RepID=A0AAN7R759_TRANT|nr:hypothetical protein SAY86_018019 [Trapa natans]
MEVARLFDKATSSRDPSASDEGTLAIVNQSRPFTSNDVLVITRGFKFIIGEGGFGNVYLGTLNDRTKVAVKVLSPSSDTRNFGQRYKTGLDKCIHFPDSRSYTLFLPMQAQLLMIVHHKNLVSLIGYCDDPENLSLVYEYMINGNMRQHLSGNAENALSWSMRFMTYGLKMVGLEYLRKGCRSPIVHRDFKTSNILLNDKMQAKIADFGLSRVFVTDQKNFGISTLPAGTPGYNISGNLNSASDIYSFGVLFELIIGYPTIIRDSKGSTHVVQWVTPFIEKGDVQSTTDPRIHGLFDASSAWKALEIATQ